MTTIEVTNRGKAKYLLRFDGKQYRVFKYSKQMHPQYKCVCILPELSFVGTKENRILNWLSVVEADYRTNYIW